MPVLTWADDEMVLPGEHPFADTDKLKQFGGGLPSVTAYSRAQPVVLFGIARNGQF